MKKISVAVVGASGVIGQHYVALLQNHPWFELTCLAASDGSSNRNYEELVKDKWYPDSPLPTGYVLQTLEEVLKRKPSLIFSALPNEVAAEYDLACASAGLGVISSASFHRNFSDTPLIIPEINAAHLLLIQEQQRNRKWQKGFIVSKPNCALQSFLIPLAPLHREFTIESLSVTTLQAISGAGQSLTPSSINNNIIPYIAGEEEKVEEEPHKILGTLFENKIIPSDFPITAQCNRVPIIHGHTACFSFRLKKKVTKEEILSLWKQSSSLTLPSAPSQPIFYHEAADRPQPKLDLDGMGVIVGRLRSCPVFDWRCVALSHNAIRGGAGGGILTAELLYKEGYCRG